jgi:hypothetical protein
MKILRSTLMGAALVVATATITAQVVSQDKKAPPQPQLTPEQQKAMEAMEARAKALATPGENHKLLDYKVGKWTGEVSFFMPGMPADKTTCTTEYSWILDGRYLTSHTDGQFNGQTFEGHSVEGYDNLSKKFFFGWIDNMGTGLMTAEGTYDAGTKTWSYSMQTPDETMTKYVKGRSTEKKVDNDHFVGEMYSTGPDGKEYKSMEIRYTRAK